ncbi:hypothetical protein [Bradyrhizobium sp.]|uniref:hypothetical protein n=1 Tax=Bradyrhizobium sp. TaxID=376 RepID=UPI0025BA1C97|nr:hypothetical protein [Bradyrhizobium sp.]
MPSIRTPELVTATVALNSLIDQARRGKADVEQGRVVIGAANGICRLVKTDLERRMAAPKLQELEARTVQARPTRLSRRV